MQRTAEQILERMAKVSHTDFFGTQVSDLLGHLSYEQAKPWLVDTATQEKWDELRANVLPPADSIKDYMPFAWGKANDCRGLSSMRSVDHMQAWLWLDGNDLADSLRDLYDYYGKPCLVAVCVAYDIDWSKLDDGHWRRDERADSCSALEALTKMGKESLMHK